MKNHRHSDITNEYYTQHAADFSSDTLAVDMSPLYAEFVPLIPQGGSILDAGCGSGRDAAYFRKHGFNVTAFDANAELARMASAVAGLQVQVMGFGEVSYADSFDGVWACASLLHVPAVEMNDVIGRLLRALKPLGKLYASFKYGQTEGVRSGRFFNDYDAAKFTALSDGFPGARLMKMWVTNDARPGRNGERWLNAIVEKGVQPR